MVAGQRGDEEEGKREWAFPASRILAFVSPWCWVAITLDRAVELHFMGVMGLLSGCGVPGHSSAPSSSRGVVCGRGGAWTMLQEGWSVREEGRVEG